MKVAHYKELYEQEWQRREQLQSAANTPISLLTLLGGSVILMGNGFDSEAPWLLWPFWTAAAVAALLGGASTFFLIRSIHGYEYERIPHASQLAVHYENLRQYYAGENRPGATEPAFDEYLSKQYILATDSNAVNNINRGEYLYKANRFLVYTLVATALAAVPAGVSAKTAQDRPQDIRITNLRSDGNEILRQWHSSLGPAGTPEQRRAERATGGTTRRADKPQAADRERTAGHP